ncbi:transglycosylase domain-containing protein [Halomonas sp. 328]|uniref:transglycosylase domain-containing protein n=1 Tax=Halomonas sp. 328 TaxID=2776704 RepID=UPI0018A7C5D1|nr:transglycosylase domain-containing protein [Halomonas sp. 328]MBF8224273.1 penicillin-binding protein [Halomonas sp. 328]
MESVPSATPGGDDATAADAGPRRRWPWRLLLVSLLALLVAGIASLLAAEARTSRWQALELSRFAESLDYHLEPGPSDALLFPRHGPFNQRFGYVDLPRFQARLEERGYDVASQVRFTPALQDYASRGFYVPYEEKTRTGLTLEECRGHPYYAARHPQRHYPHFAAIPPLVLESLLFIENRGLLDATHRYANPAVDWPRFARAALSQVGRALELEEQSAGGSTLATQMEKFRHSPGGRTGSAREKLRQMVSASVRTYRHGPETLTARQDLARDYLNSVPLAAAPGFGEVHGLGDGLWVWFGADFDEINRLLEPAFATPEELAQRGQALRRVVALMIAQRRPAWYLNGGRDSLERLTDSYLRLLHGAQLVNTELRDAALAQRLEFRDFDAEPVTHRLPTDKGRQVARTQLARLLGLSFYDLDRLDLEASTTLHGELQARVTDYLESLADPEVAAEVGILGHRLLSAERTADVTYSFTLFERSEAGFLVRVQTDNTGQPFDLNESSKLELGSTAKLRVLTTYLEILAELHEQYRHREAAELRDIPVDRQDVLTRWVIDRLLAEPALPLEALLEQAMARRYSASPHERFFTGGGQHTFSNFRNEDNHRNATLTEAMQESLNLPFVRLMRDIVNHHIYRHPDRRRLLENDAHPLRMLYLSRFADREGRVFLERFWRKYRALDPDARLETLFDGIRPHASRLAAAHRYVLPDADLETFHAFIRGRLGDAVPEARIERLYRDYGPGAFDLNDQGYLARIHPLELWLVRHLQARPQASYRELASASTGERQAIYQWLFTSRHRGGRDTRIRILLEADAFEEIHERWARVGFPFERLVPSLATAIGSSGDRPAALAELVGIILNDGVRLPTLRIDGLHFAADTPFETRLTPAAGRGERVMAPEVAATLRHTLAQVVEDGTARRLQGSYLEEDGTALILGGKTGTGNNRFETRGRSGQLLDSQARSRTATFVFYLGDRHFGTLTAYVPGRDSDDFRFTSALPVQILKGMEPLLRQHLGDGCRQSPPSGLMVSSDSERPSPGA